MLKPSYLKVILIFFLLALTNLCGKAFVNAEVPIEQQPGRLKIGLALGGGAAGGFAQIGILRWLEENRIPVDCIAGTSMGGLLGACYSMGMSPQDIENLVNSTDWNGIFDPLPPYDSMDFRRKEDALDYPLSGVGLRDGKLTIPSGLNIYKIDLILSRITLSYSLVTDFDKLPIPFQCVATDIRNGESVILDSGSLEKALRATMSIPGVFQPVEYNGRLLVDGGILDNVPVDAVKKMGADVVIAVNIASPLPKNRPENIATVISRTLDTVTGENVKKSITQADILIEPAISELGLYQWEAAERYIELGYQATANQKKALLKYALDESSWRQYCQQREKRYLKSAPIPQRIVIKNASNINKADIQRRFQKYAGKPVEPSQLDKDLTALMGSGLFEGLSYEFAMEDGQPVLMISMQEKTYGPPFFRSKLQTTIGSSERQNTLGVRMVYQNIAGSHAEMRLDLNMGSDHGFQMELYQPLFDSRWFIAPSVYFQETDSSLFDSGRPITDYQVTDYGLNFDVGCTFNQFSEIRLGYTQEHQHTGLTVGDPLNSDYNGEVQSAHLRWKFSSADDPLLPLQGLTINSNAVWYFNAPDSTNAFGSGEGKILWNCLVWPKVSVFTLIAGGISSSNDIPLPQQYSLGGLFRLGAYGFDEFHGANYVLGSAGFLKNVTPLGANIYLGIWSEYGGVYEHGADLQLKNDLSVGIIDPTILGPLFFCLSCAKNGESVYYMGLGHFF